MGDSIKVIADSILNNSVGRAGGAPGVVAMATDSSDNFYEGAAGVRELGEANLMTTDSVMLLASCTKALVGTALMQLVEEGLVSLDDPAKEFTPEIADIQVLDGFKPDGEPILRKPKSDITLKELMLHTSGLGYDFFSEDLLKYRNLKEIPSILSCTFDSVRDVLLHDPGQNWTYGCGIDWVGLACEAVRGKRLGEVLKEYIFSPLEMRDIAFTMTDSMRDRLVTIHQRDESGQLTAQPDLILPQPPEMDMGGHGLYSTIGEYMKFIRMIINDGNGPQGRVLKAETVEQMAKNGLGNLKSCAWNSSNPALANSGDFFPGLTKSWGLTFQVNDEQAPTGRPAGQLSWAGIANSFYWIDRKNGIGGMWSSQILPFQDIASYPGFVDFETAVYRSFNTEKK